MKSDKNIIELDPFELIKKVKDRYGNNPIFPERIKEARANLYIYQEIQDKYKKRTN